ncbi:reverse transcriptase [Gossypium australe]|uniref:Reverse transcriptase n=1 Tax=Gossypium australe TaxID=47621 RepID=A0A5B6VCS9_9ROSI|nr:reverse transcriptase [Gossypium australe]
MESITTTRKRLECDLSDLGFSGQWFTWNKENLAGNNIRERLDRGVANTKRWELFPSYSVEHLQHNISGHCPILLNTVGRIGGRTLARLFYFHFNVDWVLEENFEEQIVEGWESSGGDVPGKLATLGSKLSRWASMKKAIREGKKQGLQSKLRELNKEEPIDEVLAKITDIKLALNLAVDKEEIFWEQRIRENWLRLGDRNTSFFHKVASGHKKNTIRGLKGKNRKLVYKDGELIEITS